MPGKKKKKCKKCGFVKCRCRVPDRDPKPPQTEEPAEPGFDDEPGMDDEEAWPEAPPAQ